MTENTTDDRERIAIPRELADRALVAYGASGGMARAEDMYSLNVFWTGVALSAATDDDGTGSIHLPADVAQSGLDAFSRSTIAASRKTHKRTLSEFWAAVAEALHPGETVVVP